MDRGYESYNVMAHFQERGWQFLIRIRDGRNSIKNSFHLPQTATYDQHLSVSLCRKQTKELKGLYKNSPNEYKWLPANQAFDFLPQKNRKADPTEFYPLHFRIVRLEISPDNYETLVTNTDYTPEELKNLYASRWGIETSFRDLKYSVGMINLHSKKKEGIKQEIYAHFINYNFDKWLCSYAVIKQKKRKYNYKICFSQAVFACKRYLNGLMSLPQLKTYIERHLTPIRPNRTFRRRLRTHPAVSFTYRIA